MASIGLLLVLAVVVVGLALAAPFILEDVNGLEFVRFSIWNGILPPFVLADAALGLTVHAVNELFLLLDSDWAEFAILVFVCVGIRKTLSNSLTIKRSDQIIKGCKVDRTKVLTEFKWQ